jgi:hypothetical protein
MKMCGTEELTSRQGAVLDGLFGGELGEAEVLARHKVKPRTFYAWLGEYAFIAELKQRAEAANRKAEILLAAYRPQAAARLIELTKIDKDNTARLACLDILGFKGYEYEEEERKGPTIPYDKASKVWAALAKIVKEEREEEKARRAKKGPIAEKEDNGCSLPAGRIECAQT